MTYAFRHIRTFKVATSTTTVVLPLIGEELSMHNVKHLEMRIRSFATNTAENRLILTTGQPYTFNVSTWSYALAVNNVQGNNAVGANAVSNMVIGTTAGFETQGYVKVIIPFIYGDGYSLGPYQHITAMSRSTSWDPGPNTPTNYVLEFSNSSLTTSQYPDSFLNDSLSFRYQSGNISAGSEFALYGWSQ